jgi:hypothetical protein
MQHTSIMGIVATSNPADAARRIEPAVWARRLGAASQVSTFMAMITRYRA